MNKTITEFSKPPIHEVAIGFQFDPLPNFQAIHLGLFWEEVRDKYPTTQDHPPVPTQIEFPELQPAKESFAITGKLPIPRCWFIAKDPVQLLQVQNNRLTRNWRKIIGDESYPRYDALINDFFVDYTSFSSFVEKNSLGQINMNLCELTYINRIEKGNGWESVADFPKMFTVVKKSDRPIILPDPEMISCNMSYKLPDNQGRLHVALEPVFAGKEFKISVGFNLIARGSPKEKTLSGAKAWYELAHEWVIKAFEELTTIEMHELWGKYERTIS